jgi:uncharacterized protein
MSWALIAGGSKGIGLGIAEALAKRKYNLFLIARDHDDLQEAKNRIENKFSVQVEILSLDLADPASADQLFDWIKNKLADIKVVCHAAGMGGSLDYPDLPLEDLRTMIRLNLESAVALSYLFTPLLKQSAPSYMLLVSSMAGFSPIPIKNVYAATKSALIFFSYSLRYYLKQYHISVSCFCPGPVFSKPAVEKETRKQMGWMGKQMSLTSAQAGESAVRGMFKREMIIVPGKLAVSISSLLRILPNSFVSIIFQVFKKQRKSDV